MQKEAGLTPECPVCRQTPERICVTLGEVAYPVGTMWEEISLETEVVFLDGHAEKISRGVCGWQDDYDENYCGFQNVTVMYYDVKTVVSIVTEGGPCLHCGAKCTGRSFGDYQEFPYCDACMAEVPLFTGEVYREEQKMSLERMIAEIDRTGRMQFKKGDLLTAVIRKKGKVRAVLSESVNNDGNAGGE